MDNKKFAALAFDLDGTLYPNYRFYIRLVPFVVKEQRLLRAFGKARDRLRTEKSLPGPEGGGGRGGFYDRQARFMAEILNQPQSLVKEKVERLIYKGWEPIFKKIKLYPHVTETLLALKDGGVKLGLLSDFPPETKLKYLNIPDLWDTVLCSENIGELKPDPLPFEELARRMGLPPEKILYVGNSFAYDVLGARKAGMKAAWITRGCAACSCAARSFAGRSFAACSRTGGSKAARGQADFVFSGYRQLRDYVLS